MTEIAELNQTGPESPEQSLVEAVLAEKAGVFRSSPVDPVALLASPNLGADSDNKAAPGGSRRWLSVARMVAPLAACLVIWMGFRSTVDTSNLENPGLRSSVFNADGTLADGDVDCSGLTRSQVSDCLSNLVGSSLSAHCACADADQDGDFDLADFGHLQRSLQSHSG